MKAAIYCRVSTDDQEREGTSLQTQTEACLNYCQDKGYQVSYRFKEAYSGLSLQRPKLTELRDLVRTGSIDVIVVYCLDRLSRDPNHGVIITEEFERYGVALQAVTETIESTDLGRLISYIRGYASKLEAEKIKERTMRGKLAHLKNGEMPQGTGIGLYGYKWDKSAGRRVIIEHEAKVVKKIFNMAISSMSTNQIAFSLNKANVKTKCGKLWFPLTIRRLLQNRSYTGKTYFGQTKRAGQSKIAQPKENWILLPDITPLIITDEIFDQAQEAIKKAKESRPVKVNSSYLLTGFTKCYKCGSPIVGTALRGKYRYYKCSGTYPTATRGKICNASYIKAEHIENFVWERLRKMGKSPGAILRALDSIEKDGNHNILPILEKKINKLKKSLKFYAKRIPECYEILKNEDEYQDKLLDVINELKRKRADDELGLKQLQESLKKISQAQQVKVKFTEYCRNVRDAFSEDMDIEKKRDILRLFQAQVLAEPGHYTLATSVDAEIQSKHCKLLHSLINDKNLAIIEHSSGYLISCTYDYPSGNESIDIIPVGLARK